MKKVRMTIYLDPTVHAQLVDYAAKRRQPLSVMAEAAVGAFVNPDEREIQMVRRMSRMERQLDKLSRDTNISVEAFLVYIWLWLGANPALPDTDNAARASTTERYDRFMETLGQRLATGKPVASRVLAE